MIRARVNSGFSLIELILALAIVALLAGLLVVDYSGGLTYERLKSSCRKLAGFCERARSEAVSRQGICRLQIDFTNSRYRFVPDPHRDEHGLFIHPESELVMTEDELVEWDQGYEWESLPDNVFFVDLQVTAKSILDERHKVATIDFPPDGSVDPFIIHLKTSRNEVGSVIMNGLTGIAEAEPSDVRMAAAEPTDFNQVMGGKAPGSAGGGNDNKKSEQKSGDKSRSGAAR